MATILRGIESETLEMDGTLAADARPDVPAPLTLPAGPAHVNVLFFAMRKLALRGVPWPAFDYVEALWRMSVRFEGEPAWLAVACDIDRGLIRALGRRIVRYPTRVASFDGRWAVEVDGALLDACVMGEGESPAPVSAKRTFVRDRAKLYEIPWEEIPASDRHTARVEVRSDSLSERTFDAPVAWNASALVHRGRTHMCGIARRV